MAHDVFVSYSTKDKPTADAICAALEANGIRCWIAPRDILPGSDWGEAIIDAIHACRAMVLVFSGSSNASSQIKREIERAVNVGIPVLPFRIEDVLPSKTLEYFISTQHWLDALTPPPGAAPAVSGHHHAGHSRPEGRWSRGGGAGTAVKTASGGPHRHAAARRRPRTPTRFPARRGRRTRTPTGSPIRTGSSAGADRR